MGKKHVVMALGFGYLVYSGIKTFKYLKTDTSAYFANLGAILGVTLILLYLIYLGEKWK